MAYEGTTLDDRYGLVDRTISNAGGPNLRDQLRLTSLTLFPDGIADMVSKMVTVPDSARQLSPIEVHHARRLAHSIAYLAEADQKEFYSYPLVTQDGTAAIVTHFPNHRKSIDDVTYEDMHAITQSGHDLALLFGKEASLDTMVQVFKLSKIPKSKSVMIRGYTLPVPAGIKVVSDMEADYIQMLMQPSYGVNNPMEAFKEKAKNKGRVFHWDEFSQLSVPYDVTHPKRIDNDTRISRFADMTPEQIKYVGENMLGAIQLLLRDPSVDEVAIVAHEARKGSTPLNRAHYHILPKVNNNTIPQPEGIVNEMRRYYAWQKPPVRAPLPQPAKKKELQSA